MRATSTLTEGARAREILRVGGRRRGGAGGLPAGVKHLLCRLERCCRPASVHHVLIVHRLCRHGKRLLHRDGLFAIAHCGWSTSPGSDLGCIGEHTKSITKVSCMSVRMNNKQNHHHPHRLCCSQRVANRSFRRHPCIKRRHISCDQGSHYEIALCILHNVEIVRRRDPRSSAQGRRRFILL